MATYREPGVYLTVSNSNRGAYTADLPMFPVIIGTGPSKLRSINLPVVKSGEEYDVLPFTTVDSILKVSDISGGAAKWVVTTDYSAEAPNRIRWMEGKGPVFGQTYYVDIVYLVDESQYNLRNIGPDEVTKYYGPDIQENEPDIVKPICPISLGAQLCFSSGARSIYTVQVKKAGSTPTVDEYNEALNKIKTEAGVWRIIPMDLSTDIVNAVRSHVLTLSTVEERMERTALYSIPYSQSLTPPTEFAGDNGVLSVIGGFTSSIANKRIVVPYPDTASKILSDGVKRDLNGPYLMAALAGAEQAQAIYKSMTRSSIGSFYELKGVKMTRTQKNQLAERGVLVLEQESINGDVTVRHQLSTDMSTTQSREMSLLHIQDYCSKSLRKTLEQYIGRRNIDFDFIQMLKGSVENALSIFVKNNIIVSYEIGDIYQDEENPDAIIVGISVRPPYPCNYIDITLYVE